MLTAEFAEEGAEDGAGAEVHVDEPWEGYSQMRVNEIKERLAGATLAEAAAVELLRGRTSRPKVGAGRRGGPRPPLSSKLRLPIRVLQGPPG